LLKKWNPKINLVSAKTISEIWSRHFLDSAQIFELTSTGETWTDLGSGGGFPGLVISILAAETRPDLRVTLVESDLRKSAFLTHVARALSLDVQIVAERIENLEALNTDYLSARALAPLDKLLGFVDHHLAADGTALFLKGESWKSEIDAAKQLWSFEYEAHPSKTGDGAAILVINGVKRV
jgi:16S rRNA (guanine527-N7)-methyltransferase